METDLLFKNKEFVKVSSSKEKILVEKIVL
jgi:hypothetical protein